MITVIDNYNESAFDCYKGMSLGDAVNSMVLESHNVVSELMMDVLLTEHSYLYENATEITYVNEDGKENANGVSLKEKIGAAVDKVRTFIAGAWNNFISWVQNAVEDIVTKIKKLGVSKKQYEENVKVLRSAGNVMIKTSKWALSKDVDNAINGLDGFRSNIGGGQKFWEPGEYFKQFAKEGESDYISEKDDQWLFDKAGQVVFDSKGVINKIRKNQKEMDAALIKIKKIAMINDPKGNSDTLKAVSESIKNNANVAKDKIKLYNKNITANLAIVRDVIRSGKDITKKRAAADKAQKVVDAVVPEKKEEAKNESSAIFTGKYFAE